MADPGDNPIAVALNTLPRYVASTTLTDPRWANTTVLSSEVAAAVGELRAKPGRELQVHGSRTLIRWLFDNDLVDEITLLTFPVVVGQGTRLFPDTGPDTALELVESRGRPQRGDDPGLPTHRTPAVRNGHGRHEARDIDTSSTASGLAYPSGGSPSPMTNGCIRFHCRRHSSARPSGFPQAHASWSSEPARASPSPANLAATVSR